MQLIVRARGKKYCFFMEATKQTVHLRPLAAPHIQNMFKEVYEEYFIKQGDARVLEWPLMRDPIAVIYILLTYWISIYVILPIYMRTRKAYNLKPVIQAYNLMQIGISITLAYGFLTSGWLDRYGIFCEPVDYSDDPTAVRLLLFTYFYFITKIIDLVETAFFILRHKQNQVTKLHVYHHSVMVIISWIITKYLGGGMGTFGIMLNSIIHILMYFYYFCSAINQTMQKKIAHFKPKLTIIQMIQFWVIVIHGMQVLQPDCDMNNLAAYVTLPNVAVIFFFFLNFYFKRYKNNVRSK